MQPDRRRSAALPRPVPAAAGAPSPSRGRSPAPSRGRFGPPWDVRVPGQGGVAFRDARPPSDAEASEAQAPAPPPEDGGQAAPGGVPEGAPGGPGQSRIVAMSFCEPRSW
ncbi:hypothetical protein GCM10009802_52830 [Streptomyces synnematoformans]|uniref:Uncharacterized protein n=1 Tax=Streptomyces synnematoformans TaxID=415721 RepID=A0ABN2ZH62_9ACTN